MICYLPKRPETNESDFATDITVAHKKFKNILRGNF